MRTATRTTSSRSTAPSWPRSDAGALTEATRDAIDREIDRLERTPAQNMEHGWIRTWLDTVLGIPWAERTTDDLDIDDARRILDADHTGLDEVKERIVEFLAVRKLRAERGSIEGRRGKRSDEPTARTSDPQANESCRSTGSRGHRRPGRPAGRRQDVARRVGGTRPRPQVRPGRPRRHPRRGRDPRPPPHLRRRAARPHRAGHHRGRHA